MTRPVIRRGNRRTVVSKPAESSIQLDDRPLSLCVTEDGKHAAVVVPYEIWVFNTATLEVEKTIELPIAHPTLAITEADGSALIGGQHLYQSNLFAGVATKLGSKLGGFVDHVCSPRPRLLCGVGSHGEVLWDLEKETDLHRRKTSERPVYGLVASPDGRAIWADGTPSTWVIDPDHPEGYMRLKLKHTSPVEVPTEGIIVLGQTTQGRTILAARDGAVAWTNRALRIEGERMPAGRVSPPIAATGDERWIYVLRADGVLHRFLIEQPSHADVKEPIDPLPEAQSVRLQRMATCVASAKEGQILFAGPQSDAQLGRVWKASAEALTWEPLAFSSRLLVQSAPSTADTGKKPDFTQVRSKLLGPPIHAIKVDDVLSGTPHYWVTRNIGTVLERPTDVIAPESVLPGDALLLPAMFRLHEGTARPGLVLWPGVPDHRPIPPVRWLTWGDDPRAWLVLETPAIRQQGWSRRGVFPLQVALAHAPPNVSGHRPQLPEKWKHRELFEALMKECKKLLKVLW